MCFAAGVMSAAQNTAVVAGDEGVDLCGGGSAELATLPQHFALLVEGGGDDVGVTQHAFEHGLRKRASTGEVCKAELAGVRVERGRDEYGWPCCRG